MVMRRDSVGTAAATLPLTSTIPCHQSLCCICVSLHLHTSCLPLSPQSLLALSALTPAPHSRLKRVTTTDETLLAAYTLTFVLVWPRHQWERYACAVRNCS